MAVTDGKYGFVKPDVTHIIDDDLHDIGENFQKIEDDLGKESTTPLSLNHGENAVTVDQNTPYNVLSVKGRTLVNLLGKDGNCEDTSKWGTSSSTIALDSTNKVYGNYSIKVTSTATTFGNAYKVIDGLVDTSKYYLIVAMVKNGTASREGATIGILNKDQVNVFGQRVTDTTKFNFTYLKLAPSDFGTGAISMRLKLDVSTNNVGEYAYFDGVALYEITQEAYNKIGVDPEYTGDKLAEKFGYVDSIQGLQGIHIKQVGKNLLPPFTEWILHANAKVVEPYKLQLNATGAWQNTEFVMPVLAGQPYAFSGTLEASVAGVNYGILVAWFDASGVQINPGGTWGIIRSQTESSYITGSLTPPSNAVKAKISLTSAGAGTFTFTNPQLELGSTATEFEPHKTSSLYLWGDKPFHSSLDGTVYDEIVPSNGDFIVRRRFKEMVLDGSLAWAYIADFTGFKQVRVAFSDFVSLSERVVKYDGKILSKYQSPTIVDMAFMNTGYLNITISDTDSGWGETYTPTAQEIQAYFNGWKMNNGTFGTPYNGTGTKTWVPWNATDNTGAVTTVPTTPSSAITNKVCDYYKLVYQLANMVEEPVHHEGSLMLEEGTNTLTVSEGVVVREKANPQFVTNWFINDNGLTNSRLKYRTEKIIAVYKNGIKDNLWNVDTGNPYGKQRAWITPSNFDPTATYEVTYIVLDKHLYTTNVQLVEGEYPSTLRAVINKVLKDLKNLKTKVSVLEQRIASMS